MFLCIKKKLIDLFENLYASNLILGMIYKRMNKDIRIHVMDTESTIKYILNKECSIARFGEGEIELILYRDKDLGFQKHSDALAEKLRDVLKSEYQNLLICVPYAFHSIKGGRTKHSRMFWYSWAKENDQLKKTAALIEECGKSDYLFGDTQISRPYIAYRHPVRAKKVFKELKKIWGGKDILIVEGSQTRLGVGNDLFENVKSMKRILAPALNAYDKYDEIFHATLEIYDGELILIALGPTATVLACDLARQNIRALDIGHIDIEYEWLLMRSKGHDTVIGKYTNESSCNGTEVACRDEGYLHSIVRRIE